MVDKPKPGEIYEDTRRLTNGYIKALIIGLEVIEEAEYPLRADGKLRGLVICKKDDGTIELTENKVYYDLDVEDECVVYGFDYIGRIENIIIEDLITFFEGVDNNE